jgi:hypothetical protein
MLYHCEMLKHIQIRLCYIARQNHGAPYGITFQYVILDGRTFRPHAEPLYPYCVDLKTTPHSSNFRNTTLNSSVSSRSHAETVDLINSALKNC